MSQLALQLWLGAGLIVAGTILQAIGIGLLTMARPRMARWLGRVRRAILMAVLAGGALWLLSWQMAGIWLWAGTLLWVGAFPELEDALYLALSAYTTLGFGDVLPPEEWRILGAVAGAHGMLGFGLGTAALIEFMQGLRRGIGG